MTYMGYETPVQIPVLDLYDTRLMLMYMQEAKDLYEQGKQEMKDFMKEYGDFYSPINGATEQYNKLTVGGARDLINQMMANGIDPYKSPEARAAISRYIASVPVGKLNQMKQDAENAKEYKKNRDRLIAEGKFDPEYEKWRLGGKTLETWDPNKPFTETTPYAKQDWASVAAPYLKEFKKTERLDSDIKGWIKEGVSPENQKKGVDAVMNAAGSTPWLQYRLLLAYDNTEGMRDENGLPLSEEQRRTLAAQDVRKEVENTAAQYYQPEYSVDPYYKSDYETNNNIRQYWATTGSNPSPSDRHVKTNGTSRGGAHGDSGKWSRYASITYGTLSNRDEFAKNHKIPIYIYTDSKGKKTARYGEWVTVPGTNEKALMVEIQRGGMVINGKHYRRVTDAEIQARMVKEEISKNAANHKKTTSWDIWNTQSVKTGNDEDLTQITFTPATAGYLYDVKDVMSAAVGVASNPSGRTHIIREKAQKMHKVDAGDGTMVDTPTTIYDTHEAADIVLKNGRTGKYTKVIVDYGNGPVEMLYKLGEYDKNGHMVPKWQTRMSENDRIMSEATVGSSDAVEIHNIYY